jgi:hypothetical protein
VKKFLVGFVEKSGVNLPAAVKGQKVVPRIKGWGMRMKAIYL